MASPVDIANIGLAHIGARQQVNSISPPDGSVEAGYCARFYPIARRAALELHDWSFARKRAALAEVTNPSTVWLYAYALPSDCLKARRVLPLAVVEAYAIGQSIYRDVYPEAVEDNLFTEQGGTRFELEGNVLLTNEPDAVLLYTREITDTQRFTPLFVDALGMMMASYLAGPIIKGLPGAQAAARWRQSAIDLVGMSAASDANATAERNDFVPGQLAARA